MQRHLAVLQGNRRNDKFTRAKYDYAVVLEDIFQSELDEPRVHACGIDNPETRSSRHCHGRVGKLGVVESIEEFRSELESCVLPQSSHNSPLSKSEIRIVLPGTEEYSAPGIAEIRAVCSWPPIATTGGAQKAALLT